MNTAKLQKFADDVFAAVEGFVRRGIEPLAARLAALEAREPQRGEKGDPGERGIDGKDGRDGIDGKDGKDGRKILSRGVRDGPDATGRARCGAGRARPPAPAALAARRGDTLWTIFAASSVSCMTSFPGRDFRMKYSPLPNMLSRSLVCRRRSEKRKCLHGCRHFTTKEHLTQTFLHPRG